MGNQGVGGPVWSGEDKKTPAQSIQERVHHIKSPNSPNKYGQTELDSEKEGVEEGKPEDAVKFQAAKDRFHLPEFYVFVQQSLMK